MVTPAPATAFGMPVLGLGTLNNKGERGTTLVEAALAEGYRNIDTAEYYGNEDAVGRALARSSVAREDVWVTTKILHPNAPRPSGVRAAAHASLRRLDLDYVDCLLIHWPNPHFELDEALDVFVQLRNEGTTRFIGVSNFPSGLVRRAVTVAPDLVLNQIEYHPYLSQATVLAAARAAGLFVVAHSPLARGRVKDDPVLGAIAEETDRTAPQVALRWLLQQDGVGAIPGGSPDRLADLRENLGCLDFVLTDDQMQRISDLAAGVRIVDGEHAPVWDDEGQS